ncbi:tetratricopeptide repeat protein [Streptomyces sp. NPDC005122]
MLELPAYRTVDDGPTLSRRLLALTEAGRPAVCPVHVGLGDPVALSGNDAIITHTMARHLVAGTADSLPPFNSVPHPALRVLTAASWDRVDAMTADFSEMPAELTSSLWSRVDEVCRPGTALSPAERSVAAEVMLRLGFPLRAAEVLDLLDADVTTHVFRPGMVRAELQTFMRLRPQAHRVIEGRALRAAADTRLAPGIRLKLANYIVVLDGKRGTATPEFHQAVDLARRALEEMSETGMVRHLAEHTLYRAIAFEPYLRGDREGTLEDLGLAAQALREARPAADSTDSPDFLSWSDHAFPMFETLSKTLLGYGEVQQALDSTTRLVEINPNDHRTWAVRGRALAHAGDLGAAVQAWERILPLGGLPVAAAAFFLGWAHEQFGDTDRAREFYELSHSVDPTPDAIARKATPLV